MSPDRSRRRAARSSTYRTGAACCTLLVAVLALLAGCSRGASVTEVTVKAGPVTVTLPVALSCAGPTGATTLTCSGGENDGNAPHLTLAPGTPLDVEVPTDVGNTPWVIVLSYIDAKGKAQGDRTPVFAAKARFSYHLIPPAGAQLTRLEVQSLIAAQAAGGGVDFPAVRTWVLLIDKP